MVAEEIYNSLHNREIKVAKDSNNNNNNINSTISTKAKPKIDKHIHKPNEINDPTTKEKKCVKISDTKSSPASDSSQLQSGTNTLKRKRESKSPMKMIDSPPDEESNKKLSSSSQTIATILVSKTKTKTGLPLLLKK